MGLFDDVFGGGQEAAAKRLKKGQQRAMEEAQAAWGDEQGFLNPQLEAFGGKNAMQAMLDPNAFYSQLMSGYEMSPAAQREMAAGGEAIQNQMAASGLGGSSNAARDALRFAQDFSSNDMQRFFQNQMGIFGQGMGVGNNLAQFRDMLGQRRAQGQIGMSQANAMQSLGRAGALNNALGAVAQGFGNYMSGAAPNAGTNAAGSSASMQTLAQILGFL